jgi:hypothetical protein
MCNCRDANHPAFGGFTPNFQWEVDAIAILFFIFDRKNALKTNESFVTFNLMTLISKSRVYRCSMKIPPIFSIISTKF